MLGTEFPKLDFGTEDLFGVEHHGCGEEVPPRASFVLVGGAISFRDESDLSPFTAKYRAKSTCMTQNKTKQPNKMMFLFLVRDQAVGGSNPLAPTILNRSLASHLRFSNFLWQNSKLLEGPKLSATKQASTGNREFFGISCRFRASSASLLQGPKGHEVLLAGGGVAIFRWSDVRRRRRRAKGGC